MWAIGMIIPDPHFDRLTLEIIAPNGGGLFVEVSLFMLALVGYLLAKQGKDHPWMWRVWCVTLSAFCSYLGTLTALSLGVFPGLGFLTGNIAFYQGIKLVKATGKKGRLI